MEALDETSESPTITCYNKAAIIMHIQQVRVQTYQIHVHKPATSNTTEFTFGSQHIRLFCLHSASTVIESGPGIGITGILCRKFCNRVVSTDYNEEVLKIINKNIELHLCPEDVSPTSHGLVAEKLEWGNTDQVQEIHCGNTTELDKALKFQKVPKLGLGQKNVEESKTQFTCSNPSID